MENPGPLSPGGAIVCGNRGALTRLGETEATPADCPSIFYSPKALPERHFLFSCVTITLPFGFFLGVTSEPTPELPFIFVPSKKKHVAARAPMIGQFTGSQRQGHWTFYTPAA